MGDYRRYHYSGHGHRDDRSRNNYGRRERDHWGNNGGRSGGHYSGSHLHSRGRSNEPFGGGYQGFRHNRDYSAAEDWTPRRTDDDQFRKRLQPNEDFRRPGVNNMEALKYLERLRSSKPFLLKRKRDIIDSRKEKLLEEEIEDIDFCLDVISDTNADTNFGLHAIKTAHDKVLELVRNNPVPSPQVPPVVEIEIDDDDVQEISAPRSPSPEANALKNDDNVTLIPTERSQVKTDWNYRPDLSEYNSHAETGSMFNRNSASQVHSSNTPALRFNQDQIRERNDRRSNTSSNYNSNQASVAGDLGSENGGESSRTGTPVLEPRAGRKDWEGNWSYGTDPNVIPWNSAEVLPTRDQDMRLLENRPSPTVPLQDTSINVGQPSPSLLPNPTAFANNFVNGLNPNAFVANIMNSSLMNQMMVGLQLTQQQQQLLAMNMVQNQAGFFPPGSFPQSPNQPFNSLQTTIAQAQVNPQVNAVFNAPNQDNYSQMPRLPLLPTPGADQLTRNPFDLSSENNAGFSRPMFRPRGSQVHPYRHKFVPGQPGFGRFQTNQTETPALAGQSPQNSFQSSLSSESTSTQADNARRRLGSGEINGDPRLRARMEKERRKLALEASSNHESAKKELSVEAKATVLKFRALNEIAASGPVKIIGDKEKVKAEMLKSTLQIQKALAIKSSSEALINEDYGSERTKSEGKRGSESEGGKQDTSSAARGAEDEGQEKPPRREGVGSIKGFRIPKLKRPEPPQPEPAEAVTDASENTLAQDELMSSGPSSPVDQAAAELLESPESPSDEVSSTVSKHGLDAEDLLKDYLLQSLPADKLSKINSDGMAKLLSSLKGELNAKLQQLSKDDDTEESSEVGTSQPEKEAQVVSDVDDESAPSPQGNKSERKSRAVTRRRPDEKRARRSSLDKLHDALQSINFDAIMPLRPRRSTREPDPEPEISVRVTRKSRQKNSFIELGAEAVEAALKQVQIPAPLPDSTVEDSHSTSTKTQRGRKRIPKSQIGGKSKISKRSAEELDSKQNSGNVKSLKSRVKPKRGRKRKVVRRRPLAITWEKSRITRSRVTSTNQAEETNDNDDESMSSDPDIDDENQPGEHEPRMETAEEVIRFTCQTEEEPPCDEGIQETMDESIFEVDLSTLEDDISKTYNNEMSRQEIPLPILSDTVRQFCDFLLNPPPQTQDLKVDSVERTRSESVETKVMDPADWRSICTNGEPLQQSSNLEGEPAAIEVDKESISPTTSSCEDTQVNAPQSEDVEMKLDTKDLKHESKIEDIEQVTGVGKEALENEVSKTEVKIEVKSEEDDQNAVMKVDGDILKEQSEQKVQNLEGHSLYQCANESCNFTSADSNSFKEHSNNCGSVGESKQLVCYHCDKKLKTIGSLMEHLKSHGRQRQVCTLCSFRCWLNIELAKHMKLTHKVNSYKIVKILENGEAEYLMYPKDVWGKLTQPQSIKENEIMYRPRVAFTPEQISSIPRNAIFPSLVHCGLCNYSTKVRSNIIRHLNLHERANLDGGITQVPTEAPVNPVPHLETNERMFDKMTNWAGSSHANKDKSRIAAEDASKVPQFVQEQFRYVCSVSNCKQLTGDDSLLRSHMKALHSDVDTYACPHCQLNEQTKNDPRNSVTIDKIGTHLKLHGPRLLKCGHCDHIHIQTRIMERHVADKHPEKKRFHLVIRNVDGEGNNSNRRPSLEEIQKSSTDRWRCTLCRALSMTWEEAKSHCETAHGINAQFLCSSCRFCETSIPGLESHMCGDKCTATGKEASVMVMFSRNDTSGGAESKEDPPVNQALWRRDASRIKHIRGIYLEECKEPKEPKETKVKLVKPKIAKVKSEEQIITSKASKLVETAKAKSIKLLAKKRLQIPHAEQVLKPPVPLLLVCPKCKMYKTTKSNDFVIHLYNEFQYKRYECTLCVIGFVTMDSLKIHVINDHDATFDEPTHLRLAGEDPELEKHVQGVLKEQMNKPSESERPAAAGKHAGILDVSVNCKHCEVPFSSYHNYKTHLIAKHLAPDRFKCVHCMIGSWSEGFLKLHHAKAHPELEFGCVLNDELEKSLTPEFWLKEYGIPHTKWTRGGLGRVRENPSAQASPQSTKPKGQLAGKPALKRLGLKRTRPTYRCVYCLKESPSLEATRNHWFKKHKENTPVCVYVRLEPTRAQFACYCNYCSFVTSEARALRTHFRHYHRGKNLRYKGSEKRTPTSQYTALLHCSHCNHETDGLLEMESHSRDNHPNLELKYTSSIHLAHMEEKCLMDQTLYACRHCSQQYADEETCLNHMMTLHSEPMSTVAAVLTRVQKEYNLDAGRPREPTDQRLQCPKCEYEPTNLSDAKAHIQATHTYPFKCPTCFLLFASPAEAAFHFRYDHGDVTLKALSNMNAVLKFSAMCRSLTNPDGPRQPVEIDLTDESSNDQDDDNIIILEESIDKKKHQTARKSTSGISLIKRKKKKPTSSASPSALWKESSTPIVPNETPSWAPLINLTLSNLHSDLGIDDYEHYEEIADDALGPPPDPLAWDDLFVTPSTSQSQGIDFIQLGQ